MEKMLVTDEVIKKSVILLVDVEQKWFDKALETRGDEDKKVIEQKIQKRLKLMHDRLKELKSQGHTIYATVGENGILPEFQNIPDVFLPKWESGWKKTVLFSHDDTDHVILNEDIVEALPKNKKILVCGLWRERCCYRLTRLLRRRGINAILSIQPELSLEIGLAYELEKEEVSTLFHAIRYDVVDILVEEIANRDTLDSRGFEEERSLQKGKVKFYDSKTQVNEPYGRLLMLKMMNVKVPNWM